MLLRVFALCLLLASMACSSSRQIAHVRIRSLTDSVGLVRSADHALFEAKFVISNDGPLPVFVSLGCGMASYVEREERDGWRMVWQPAVCLAALVAPLRLAPGDSLTSNVTPSAMARPYVLPNDTTAIRPGRYRAIFQIGYKETPGSVSNHLPLARRTSPVFIVYEAAQ